jgi:organic hydroperoxide reductase OsmC/OhrA
MDERDFALQLTLEDGYRMTVDFGDDMPSLTLDEPVPLGEGTGPNPARVLGSAVGGCLGASLLHCMRRARIDVGGISVQVAGRVVRNDRGRWRIAGLVVKLQPELPDDQRDRLVRCIGLFEDYCIVSESVRRGIPIEIEVEPVAPGSRVLPEVPATAG